MQKKCFPIQVLVTFYELQTHFKASFSFKMKHIG